MKVLHVLETLSARYGGPSAMLSSLARAQQASGLDVEIWTTNADHPAGIYHQPGWGVLEDTSIRVFYGSVQFRPLRISLGLARQLSRYIDRYDIVHIHGIYRFPPTYAASVARKKKIPYIIRPFGSLDPYLYSKSSKNVRVKRIYEKLFDLPNLNGANAIHFTAEEERSRANFLSLRSPSFVIPNGLDWSRYQSLPERGALRERLQLGDAPLALFLSRLHPKKGLDLLIPAFAKMKMQLPEAHLIIAGPDNTGYEVQLRQWVRDCDLVGAVHFIGALDGADVQQAYVDADVFVLPSYTENFGMTVVEAMACAVPVVISDQINIHREVTAAGGGTVTRCDTSEIADALLSMLAAPLKTRREIGAAGRRAAEERYTWPRIVGQMTLQYQHIIDQSASR